MKDRRTCLDWPGTVSPIPDPPLPVYPDDVCDWTAIWSRPVVDPTAWISPGAVILGRVRLKAHASVWYGCVLRGDHSFIEVGDESNVQDGSILHVEPGRPCILGSRVTLGHRAIVHASVVKDDAMIGIGATVLSRCEIGAGALIAAGALVLEGTHVPPETLWTGVPAKQIKKLSNEQKKRMALTYRHYVNLSIMYLERFGREHIDKACAIGSE